MNIAQIKQAAIEAMGFDRLNAMQEVMLEDKTFGQNTLLLSPTGSGKTIAFLLPLIKHLSDQKSALVIVPSRELAIQIHEVFRKLKSGFRSVCCYGGHDIKKEIDALSGIGDNEPFLLIATSGRLKDHIERGNVPTNRISIVVLDEYDKSLELGFEDELKFIVTSLSHVSQLILTSATHAMPIAPWLNFRNYRQIDFLKKDNMSEDSKYEVIDNLEIYQVKSPVKDKLDTLRDLLCSLEDDAQVIVFSNYRESSERIAHFLSDHGIESSLYHGGLEQDMPASAAMPSASSFRPTLPRADSTLPKCRTSSTITSLPTRRHSFIAMDAQHAPVHLALPISSSVPRSSCLPTSPRSQSTSASDPTAPSSLLPSCQSTSAAARKTRSRRAMCSAS